MEHRWQHLLLPFYTRELLARIAVHLRTFDSFAKSEILTFEEIKLNIDTHIAQIKDVEIKLTRTEYAILKLLMQNQTQVVSKSHLLDHISEDTPDCTESSLKTHISNLRKKLRAVNGKEYIDDRKSTRLNSSHLDISYAVFCLKK